MRSFLLKNGIPVIKFSMLPDNVFFVGEPPVGFDIAVSTTDEKTVIIDVDVKNGKNGYNHIPLEIIDELEQSFWYHSKSGGGHYYFHYTGNKLLRNGTTNFGIDLRIGPNKATGNAGGYVRYYHNVPIQECMHLIKSTSKELNEWLEALFS
jgi:hypothetical protein